MCCLILRMEHKKEREPVFTYSITWALALPESPQQVKAAHARDGCEACFNCY